MSEQSSNGFLMYAWSVFGAMLLWTKVTAQKKRLNSFGDVLEQIIDSDRVRYVIQFLIFVLLGGLVAVAIVAPITATQAMAAGMAWSRLTAKD